MNNVSNNSLALVKQRLRSTGSYTGALLLSFPTVPLIAIIISIVTYVTAGRELKITGWLTVSGPLVPLLVGIIPACLLWLLLIYLCRRFTAVDFANQNACNSLLQHVSNLNWHIDSWNPDAEREICDLLIAPQQKGGTGSNAPSSGTSITSQSTGSSTPQSGQTVGNQIDLLDPRKLIIEYRKEIYLSLIQKSAAWISGTGYVHLWALMNKAEEALITVIPCEDVICEAADNEMRLNNARMQNGEEWSNKLRLAVQNLDSSVPHSSALDYLKPAKNAPPVKSSSLVLGGGTQVISTLASGASASSTPGVGGPTLAVPSGGVPQNVSQTMLARAMLRKVREALDNFDADNWSKLIEARNQLVRTTIMLALAVFAFVEFAMIVKVSAVHLVIAVIFYAFGALIGLINRLYLEATNDSAIDDYSLALARLIVAPQLSGIAAVIGVLLFQKASTLGGVYTFEGITTTLVIAATFGLAPNLLINQLKKQADGYTDNLKSTQPTTGS